jgi:hypothetical protein
MMMTRYNNSSTRTTTRETSNRGKDGEWEWELHKDDKCDSNGKGRDKNGLTLATTTDG